jgi:hypothetical protein
LDPGYRIMENKNKNLSRRIDLAKYPSVPTRTRN